MTRLDVERVLLLRDVGTHGSFTAAAQALGYTTSAISQQVAKLERETGVSLVSRHARGIELTEAGQVLTSHADRIAEALAAAQADMGDFTGLRRGGLGIATFPTAGASLLPDVLVELRTRHPLLTPTISSGRLAWLLESLRTHRAELALLWDYEWQPLDEADMLLELLIEEPTVLLLPKEHPLAGRGTIDAAELAHEDWIVRVDHPVSAVLDRVTQLAGFSPHVVLAANDYPEVQGMVAAGLGVSLAPWLAVAHHRPDVAAVELAGNPAPRRILLGRMKDRRMSPAAAAAVDVFATVASRAEFGGPPRR